MRKEGASPSVDLPGGRRTARANRSTLMAKSSKKGACSAHTVAAKGNCLQHARREGKIPSYVNPHLTHMNRTVFEDPSISRRKSIIPLKRAAERNYKAKTGQKCQKSFAPFRETCLVVRADVTDEQLKLFKKWTEQLTGWTGLGMWLHLDEGHKKSKYIEGDEGFKLNVHVHALWRCVDPATGKAIRCDRTILSKMQDLLAKATGMERGNRASETGRRGRSAKEERILQQEQRIAQLDAKITQLKEENDRLQGENQELRKENARLKVAKAVKSKVLSIVGSSRIDELEDELKRMDGMLQQTAKAKAKAERQASETSRTLFLEREANKKAVAEADRKGYAQGLKEKSYEVEELTNHVRELAAFVDPIRPGTWKYYTSGDEYRAFHPCPLYDPTTEVESTARNAESRSEAKKNRVNVEGIEIEISQNSKDIITDEVAKFREGADTSEHILNAAILLAIGYINEATTYAESHGGGGGGNMNGWGRKKDEDDEAWLRRCANTAHSIIQPPKPKIKFKR